MNGMAKLMARAGRGLAFKLPQHKLHGEEDATDGSSESESDDDKEPDRPFQPLRLWKSPHAITNASSSANDGDKQDGQQQEDESEQEDQDEPLQRKGLPPRQVQVTRPDEYGIDETVTVWQPAPVSAYAKRDVFVPPVLAKWLRPHQREGVRFMYKCVMGLKEYDGRGCILADDMGLGKTLQSVTLIYTLLKTTITADNQPTANRVIVVCPCSLVKNWENEFIKWLGPGTVKTLALAEADRKTVEKNIDSFVRTKIFNVLVCSYECLRTHVGRLTKYKDCCDLLVCDEAHRLKNADNQTSRALNSLPVRRRVLLTGTPMQNDLQEFYAMVDFTNPGILGSPEIFRKRMLFPILRGREPDATESQKKKMQDVQNEMSNLVNNFILRRVNTLNAQHLPPKLVQVVCCKLTDIQQNMYQHLISSKDMHHVLEGKQVNCLGSIQMLMKLCNHPSLIANEDPTYGSKPMSKRSAAKQVKSYNYDELDGPSSAAPGADGVAKFLPFAPSSGGRGNAVPVFPEWSGKMFVLYRLMKEMRKPGNGNDKIVIVSNYTQTLDLIGRMCRENSWGFCRLDGSINMKKRQKMVDEFNDPSSSLIAFLLSSKAGGCGLNLIGANRLVLFDPDWNPAVDKQAAARCWRDGQTKRCFTYRFLATGTVEEKIFQRQLSKEGLQSVVDDKEQINALSTKDLRNLFKLRQGTPSDTHDKLRCERCETVHDDTEAETLRVLPKKLAACSALLERLMAEPDAVHFLAPLDPVQHDQTKEEYERLVKQPIDFGTIKATLAKPVDHPGAYKNVSNFSKDVNRVFNNVLKVWNPGNAVADAARNLQGWWSTEWVTLVPMLMTMKAEDDPEVDSTNAHESTDILSQSACMNNDRGSDYQEQLGMPDEENMRHWSHHYSTDTVDDPIFRAAMRGCDSVSFVFGLEVTWSLIQQRQQEEEEAAAAELLEEMHTNGALEEDETEGNELEKSDEPKLSSVKEAKELCGSEDENSPTTLDRNRSTVSSNRPLAEGEANLDVEMEDAESSVVSSSGSESSPVRSAVLRGELEVTSSSSSGEDGENDKGEEESSTLSSTGSESTPVRSAVLRGELEVTSSSSSGEEDDDDDNSNAAVPSTIHVSKQTAPRGTVLDSLATTGNSPSRDDSISTWQCERCTMSNLVSTRQCTMCQTAMPRSVRRSLSHSQSP